MPTVKLVIRGMRDARDEQRLQSAFAAVPGVFGAVASHRAGCVDVEFEDDELAYDRLIEIARNAGFDASLAG